MTKAKYVTEAQYDTLANLLQERALLITEHKKHKARRAQIAGIDLAAKLAFDSAYKTKIDALTTKIEEIQNGN